MPAGASKIEKILLKVLSHKCQVLYTQWTKYGCTGQSLNTVVALLPHRVGPLYLEPKQHHTVGLRHLQYSQLCSGGRVSCTFRHLGTNFKACFLRFPPRPGHHNFCCTSDSKHVPFPSSMQLLYLCLQVFTQALTFFTSFHSVSSHTISLE